MKKCASRALTDLWRWLRAGSYPGGPWTMYIHMRGKFTNQSVTHTMRAYPRVATSSAKMSMTLVGSSFHYFVLARDGQEGVQPRQWEASRHEMHIRETEAIQPLLSEAVMPRRGLAPVPYSFVLPLLLAEASFPFVHKPGPFLWR